MNEDAYERAREAIKARRFEEARKYLIPIAHEPKAQAWLAKLDQIAPANHLADFPIPAPPTKERSRKAKALSWLWVIVIFGCIMLFMYARGQAQEGRIKAEATIHMMDTEFSQTRDAMHTEIYATYESDR